MDTQAALDRVSAKINAGEFGAARRLCTRFLEKNSADPAMLQIAGMIEMHCGNAARAENFLLRSDAAIPNWNSRFILAYALLAQVKFDQAMRVCDAALSLPGLTEREIYNAAEMKKDIVMVQRIRSEYRAGPSTATIRDPWEQKAVNDLTNIARRAIPAATFFHIDRNDKHPFVKKAVDYRATLIASLNAFRKSNPNASSIILTDQSSDTSWLPEGVEVARLEVELSHLMYSRMRCYRAFILSGIVSGPVLFLDTDVCVQRNLSRVFDESFDIGLTYRTLPGTWHMPVNEGVIMSASGASSQAATFFGATLDTYEWFASQNWINERYGFDVRDWRGGQLSLNATINWEVPPFASGTSNVAGARIKYFPGEEYNHAVTSKDDPHALAKKFALHFKGAAKQLMGQSR